MLDSWSAATRSCWGKTNPDTGGWLPLVQHLEDASGVMRELWAKQPGSIQSVFVEALGSEDSTVAFLTFCAGVHDIGKASTHFAFKAEMVGMGYLCGQMADQGLVGPARIAHPQPHGALGQSHLRSWLKRRYDGDPLLAEHLTCIIGGHHGANPTAAEVENAEKILAEEPPRWHEVRDEICDRMAELTSADSYLAHWMTKDIPVTVQVLTEALVIMADWISSEERLFPYGDPKPTAQRVSLALGRLHLPGPWDPQHSDATAEQLFRERFPSIRSGSPNDMQRAVLVAARSMATPGLLTLEAPMGMGKTEAAELAAEVLAERFGLGGIFFGLPTMATSNPMFSRIRAWLDEVPSVGTASISLAHSKAGLNDEYQGLMPWSRDVAVYDDSDTDGLSEHGVHREAAALVHSWFMGRKRAILANHVVGTIDQGLFAALKAKHVVLRHLGLASKVVIIDEVHAADEYMRTYLKRVLEWLGAYRTPVILMSATLPPSQRKELIAAYADGFTHGDAPDIPDTGDAYPLLTTSSATVSATPIPYRDSTTHVSIRPLDDTTDVLVATIRAQLAHGGCAGVLRNTVGRAQETFSILQDALDCEVVLLHSRFLAPHRASKEADLIDRLGRDAGNRPDKIVVVGTQVLEQSLDIDFDVMFTDLAPTDLVLQRIGRLHRHHRARPHGLSEARCFLTGVSDWSAEPPKFDRGSQAVYGRDALVRSAAVLLETTSDGITLPTDIPHLVARSYSARPDVPPSWSAEAGSAARDARTKRQRSVERAKTFLLKDPIDSSNLDGLIKEVASDPEDPKGFCQVRDSEDSIEVVVVTRDEDGQVRLPDRIGEYSRAPFPLFGPPSNELARAAASCTIALPHSLSGSWIVDRVIDDLESGPIDLSGWQQSPWLRGQLALVLDEHGLTSLADHPVRYSPELGLIVDTTTQNGAAS
ncbi:MAG: CRISPR-associated helicase Cas3' [Acidipropionibacterium jensenii]|nr:CRISPR-associated helicase Cas3' [Propionibacterium sp.]MDN6624207.1 CRISPR-associated helicase Cas3' [Acidipropionibacterium jensenii]MDN6657518.1 CRISPR-associated helicase Cas3' [Acidipropionibacterium jensenii]